MTIFNFIDHPDQTTSALESYLSKLFHSKTLVIYDIRSSISPEVLPHIPHVATYDQRILPLLSECTFICSEPFDSSILDYYKKLGLSNNISVLTVPHQSNTTLIDQIIEDSSLVEELKGSFETLIVFFPTDRAQILADMLQCALLNDVSISLDANNKTLLKQYIIESGLPHISGTITSNKDIIQQHYNADEEYFFKLPHGVSGYGFFSNKEHSLEDILTYSDNIEIIIEKKVTITSSPSVQFFLHNNHAYLFGITDQILTDGRHYNGNSSPSHVVGKPLQSLILEQASSVMHYLRDIGYQGFGGIDFMIDENNKVYITEINARFTGATPPAVVTILVHKDPLKKRTFLMPEQSEDISEELLQRSHHEIVPINIGGLSQRKQHHTVYYNIPTT